MCFKEHLLITNTQVLATEMTLNGTCHNWNEQAKAWRTSTKVRAIDVSKDKSKSHAS